MVMKMKTMRIMREMMISDRIIMMMILIRMMIKRIRRRR